MGKKKRDEKGYAVKKPFYKKVWFWGLVIFLTIGFSASLSGNKSEKTVKDTSEKVSEKNHLQKILLKANLSLKKKLISLVTLLE